MKVILKSEVDNVGLPGDVVDVADGFGRNYLIPRGLAIVATKGAMKEAEALTRSRKAREAKTVDSAEAARDVLEGRTLRIPANVDERGHLYGSVSAVDVARVLKERGHDIPRKRVELKGTIKEIGTYEVPVRVHPQVTATVTVEVVDVEGKVTKVGAEPDIPPLPVPEPDEAAHSEFDVLAEQAIEAAEELEEQEAAEEAAGDDDAGDSDAAEAAATAEAVADEAARPEASGDQPADDEPADDEEPTGS